MAPTGVSPHLFRILLPARDLAESQSFYERLLGTPGRAVAEGRIYFDCGPVILGILDYSGPRQTEISAPTEAVYFATDRLEEVHRRATDLRCTSSGNVHGDPGQPMGEITVRPWGERSFYASDPTGNALCFVDATTKFTGTPAQVEALRRTLSR